MDLQLASDLHLETHRDKGRYFLDDFKVASETLVLAGDIFSARFVDQPRMVFAAFSKKFKDVVYVPGNHEFYLSSLTGGWHNIRMAAKDFPNIHVLDNQRVSVRGLDFFGGTAWFPPFDGNEQALLAKQFMNDFYMIRNIEKDIYPSNWDFAVLMDGDVIVSHHLPDQRCVSLRYAGSPLNAFFVADMDVKACGAELWLHGHTHEQVDQVIDGVRVVANPFGYPSEPRQQAAFQEALVITI